jgi:hypothetical protein
MMSRLVGTVLVTALTLAMGASFANAGGLGIDVTIHGEITPGVYGRVDLSNRPPPRLVYAQPLYVAKPRKAVVVEPIYLHVPPGHAKNWSKHCKEYHACDRPVYFVRSAEYEPGYRPHKVEHHDDHDHHDHDDRHDHRDDHHDDHDHGHN